MNIVWHDIDLLFGRREKNFVLETNFACILSSQNPDCYINFVDYERLLLLEETIAQTLCKFWSFTRIKQASSCLRGNMRVYKDKDETVVYHRCRNAITSNDTDIKFTVDQKLQ